MLPKFQTFKYIKYKVRKIIIVVIIIIYLDSSADRGASVSEYLFYVFHVHNELGDECSGKTIWTTDWLSYLLLDWWVIFMFYWRWQKNITSERSNLWWLPLYSCLPCSRVGGRYLVVSVSRHTFFRSNRYDRTEW